MTSTSLTTRDVQNYISAHGIRAHLIRDIGHTPTVPAAAEALGVHSDQIVKTLLFLLQRPSDENTQPEPIVVISNGTNHVDKKALARRFNVGAKRVKLAPPEVVLELLGYPAGGVPPFAHRTQVFTIVDQSVADLSDRFGGRIFAGGGDDVTMMELTVTDLLAVTEPEILAVSRG